MPLPVLSQVHLDELEQVIPTLLSGAFQNTDPLLSNIPMAAPSALLCLQGPPGFLLKDIPMACNPLGSLPGGFTPSPPSPGAPCCFHPLEKQGSEGSEVLRDTKDPAGYRGVGITSSWIQDVPYWQSNCCQHQAPAFSGQSSSLVLPATGIVSGLEPGTWLCLHSSFTLLFSPAGSLCFLSQSNRFSKGLFPPWTPPTFP